MIIYAGPRVSDKPVLDSPATADFDCEHCGETIWVSNARDRTLLRDEALVLCFPCSMTLVSYMEKEEIQFGFQPGAVLDRSPKDDA